MCVVDLEPCEVWIETARTARTPHRCHCCGALIGPGARYVAVFSKFEGEVNFEKWCGRCDADMAEFADAHDGMRCNPSYFPQLLQDCISDGDPESEARWKPMLERIAGPVR